MTTRDIIELKKNINRLLAKRQLKEAFALLSTLTTNTQDWHIRQQISELETNYKYMLHYLFEGVKDPEREKMYANVIRTLYEITDDASDDLLKIESTNIFYDRWRIQELKTNTINDYHTWLKDIVMNISLTTLLEDETKQQQELVVRRERLTYEMFQVIFTSPRASSKSIQDYHSFVQSIDLSVRDKCTFISALTLNLFHRFDALKIQVLMQAATTQQMPVRARALVGLVIIMQMYDVRWELYPELENQLAVMNEDIKFRRAIERIIIQLIRSRETERISKKLQDEIIPEMMKLNKLSGKRINMEDLIGDTELTEKNPEWQKELEESGLSKKLQEYSELQMEGADVFHSTFSSLKNYPFFSDMSNWFLPFDPNYSEIAPLFVSNSKNNILHAAIVDSGHMCNSDKYSFCLSLLQISSAQREMMMSRLNAESEEIKQMQQDAIGINPTVDEEVASNQYIQDLYRFFKLSPNRSSFYDIFMLSINFYDKKSIAPLISDVESMKKIALYCFEKNNFEEALAIFLKLAQNKDNEDNLWQKIAYCYQMLGDFDNALQAYLKADLISPNNSWILRHIAQLYRRLNKYDQAILYYQKASKITPNNMSLELNIGHCYLEQEDYENALNCYFKVEMLDTNSDRALHPIAWTAFLSQKFEQAARYYERILAKKPTVHDYLNAGHVELCMHNYKKAMDLYRTAVEMDGLEHFMKLFEADKETLITNGVAIDMIPFLLDQIRYNAS